MAWRSAFFVRSRGRNSGQILILVFAAGLLLGAVALIFGPMIRLALSGVELTRNPAGPLQHHENWIHHFDTHPPIAERIAILEQISHPQCCTRPKLRGV